VNVFHGHGTSEGKDDVLTFPLFSAKTPALFLLTVMLGPVLFAPTPVGRGALAVDAANAALTEWAIPTAGSQPSGLALDPSGNCCWFVESTGNKVAHLDPSTNTFREWAIPTPDSTPIGLALTTVSGSLTVFGTESSKGKVFLFIPSTGTFREYTLPESSRPQYISIEPPGAQIRAWFTDLKANSIGEIIYYPDSKTAKLFELVLPTAAGGRARGVHTGSGVVWLAGSTAIVKLDRAVSQFTTWAVPSHPSAEAAFVDVDALGQVWYTATSSGTTSTRDYVGVLRSNNAFTEWEVPTVGAGAQAVSVNPLTKNPWIAEQGEDKIAELDPSSDGTTTSARPRAVRADPVGVPIFTHVAGPALPSVAAVEPATGTVSKSSADQFTEWTLPTGSEPHDVVVDASGDVWILESSANKVARLSLKSDFVVECNPSSLVMAQYANTTSTCTVTSIDGFSSAVELAGSWSGPQPSDVAHTLRSPVSPPPGRGASSTLIMSAGPRASTGTFEFHVTGTSGSLTHSATLEVTIAAGPADFTIVASPSRLSVPPGGSVTSTITVQSLGVFFSPVQLASSGAPYGMTLVFGTNPVTPPIGEIAFSILTVSVFGAPQGTHAVAISGTGGSITHSITLVVEVTGGACLIATATYGSELSDEVQFLRGFRDNSILKTSAGSTFMVAFNAWYYSFSPYVAEFIRENSLARTVTRLMLYPLMGILRVGASVFYALLGNLEVGAVASGLLVSSLIGIVYLSPPLVVVSACSRRVRRVAKRLELLVVAVMLGAVVGVASIELVGVPQFFMMLSTAAVVLATLAASALCTSRALLYMLKRAHVSGNA